jgi:HK97 family phage portal protein
MGFFDIFLRKRAASNRGEILPQSPFINAVVPTAYGNPEIEESLQLSAVYSCSQIISDTISCLPKYVYDATGKRAPNHAIEQIINASPNEYLDAVQAWSYIVSSAVLRGNGYAIIDRTPGGKVRLTPISSSRVSNARLVRDALGNNVKIYTIDGADVDAANVFHLTGPVLRQDGLLGISIVETYMRRTIFNGRAVENYATSVFEKGTGVSGSYKTAEKLTPERRKEVRAELELLHSGMNAGGRIAIADGGASLEPIELSPDDTKFIASRNRTVEEVCRWFRVPLHLVQSGAQSSYNSNEANNTSFLQLTLLPWCRRIEQALNRKFFPDGDYYIEFDFDSLLRPTMTERYKANLMACGRPWMTVDEIRADENLSAIAGGESLFSPLNMADAEKQTTKLEGGSDEPNSG